MLSAFKVHFQETWQRYRSLGFFGTLLILISALITDRVIGEINRLFDNAFTYFPEYTEKFQSINIDGDFLKLVIFSAGVIVIALTFVMTYRDRRKRDKVIEMVKESLYHLVPRDFGIDGRGCRQVGFRIEESTEGSDARLELFWFSGHRQPDEMKLDYPLNVTSHLLKKTADGQFALAVAHQYTDGYSLTLDDGFYGLFLIAGYYKGRISVAAKKQNKTCFDILIYYKGRAAISIKVINKVNCDDPLDRIPENEKAEWEAEHIRNWSTVSDFQPNLMYRNPITPKVERFEAVQFVPSHPIDSNSAILQVSPNVVVGGFECKDETWTIINRKPPTPDVGHILVETPKIEYATSDINPYVPPIKPKPSMSLHDPVERCLIKFENRRLKDREVSEAENIFARVSFLDSKCIEICYHETPCWRSKNLNEKPKARVNIAPDDFEQLYTVIRKKGEKELYMFCGDSYPQGELDAFQEKLKINRKLRYIKVTLTAHYMQAEHYWISVINKGKDKPLNFEAIVDPCQLENKYEG